MLISKVFFNFFFVLLTEGIVSYSIPKGVQRGMEVDLSDKTYDGYEQGDRYVDGLGQLVDGQKGKDNFRTDIHGFGKGKSEKEIIILNQKKKFTKDL